MMIRRYIVKEMPEAVLQIRKDLGRNAVILSSKRIKVKKWWGLWWLQRVEVLAATGDDVPRRLVDLRADSPSNFLDDNSAVSCQEPVQGVRSEVPEHVESPLVAEVYQELSHLSRLVTASLTKDHGSGEEFVGWLLHQGVDVPQVITLLSEVPTPQTNHLEFKSVEMGHWQISAPMRDEIRRKVLLCLGNLAEGQPIAPQSRIVGLVGPTGVGKTTTIAKLAALHVLAGQRKVGLVTTDTYRIAAVDQLRTYAKILNVPLRVIHHPEGFSAALASLEDRDLILVDTAGRSFREPEQVSEVAKLLEQVAFDEVYLVLSLTHKFADLLRWTENFSALPIHKFLFTKLDETDSYGAVLNLLLRYGKPLSYFTTGQNVPDDLEVASVVGLLERMFTGVA
ncbi:flagellar biosynthesis protein FlhF [Alicyclobacillaceae bacterium I2511]|nr:flagellar biosynthesis protein FlhF [Alicyclobacillaceae bacterium I2511]